MDEFGNAKGECRSDHEMTIVRAELTRTMCDILTPWMPRLESSGIDTALIIDDARLVAVGDLLALAGRDPASKGSWRYVLQSYLSLRAVLGYRLAHIIATMPVLGRWEALTVARSLSERVKVETGIEVHPSAKIGPRFVIDHGMGTVIGEDVVIGSDCYILQGVVLGALGIANNHAGRRHPRLGDRVQIGCFARLLGSISVGDDVVIGSHVLVRTDVLAGSQVTVLHQYQAVTGPRPVTVYGVEAVGQFQFRLHGNDLNRPGLEVELLDPAQVPLAAGDLAILQRNDKYLTVQVAPRSRSDRSVTHIRVRDGGSAVTLGIPVSRPKRDSSVRLA